MPRNRGWGGRSKRMLEEDEPGKNVKKTKVIEQAECEADVLARKTPANKIFEFRDRLRHEPPELDYSWYESYDAVQKDFKEMGGKDLAHRTAWLDVRVEKDLLSTYTDWLRVRKRYNGYKDDKEFAFYEELEKNLDLDMNDVDEEDWANDQTHGKTLSDHHWLLQRMDAVRTDYRQRRKIIGTPLKAEWVDHKYV